MSSMTAKRIRIIVDSEARRRAALRMLALEEGSTISDIVNGWIDLHCAEQLKRLAGKPGEKGGNEKRGRKPKPSE